MESHEVASIICQAEAAGAPFTASEQAAAAASAASSAATAAAGAATAAGAAASAAANAATAAAGQASGGAVQVDTRLTALGFSACDENMMDRFQTCLSFVFCAAILWRRHSRLRCHRCRCRRRHRR